LPDFNSFFNTFNQFFRIGAAAFYPAKSLEYFLPRRAIDFIQKGTGVQNFAGLAETATFQFCLGKTRYNVPVFIGLGITLYGNDLAAAYPECGNETGMADPTVKYHCTESALSAEATVLCTKESKINPQYIDETDVCLASDYHILSIQYETDGHSVSSFFDTPACQISKALRGMDLKL
jgi:hypothetical protein